MDWVQMILASIPGGGGSLAAIIGIVIEWVLRMWPTKKPVGIFHFVSAVLRKIADALDAVVGQNLKKE